MITRLQLSGFKNYMNTDIRFGPFTCIAGENGVGKSNIFDALQFLSNLCDYQISEAISYLRGKDGSRVQYSSVNDIFQRLENQVNSKLSISAEMLIQRDGEDDLGQPAQATYNFLKYTIELKLIKTDDGQDKVILTKEELKPIKKGDAWKNLLFDHHYKWRNSVIQGKRNVPYISTIEENNEKFINLHQDGGSSGKPRPFNATSLPRTVLSTARYASETPTALLAKREMQSWKFLQLEPSALRQPSDLEKFSMNIKVGSDGSNLPASVYKLSKSPIIIENYGDILGLNTELAYKLSQLVGNVKEVRVDKDEKRQILTLEVLTKDGITFPARSLSDGTLRFLALSIIDMDPNETGLVCLEEPENGIHPERIPAMIDLLNRIPVDPTRKEYDGRPLRQIIINTHSPGVVSEVQDQALIYVQTVNLVKHRKGMKVATVQALNDTWRTTKGELKSISKGKLISYLSPIRKPGNNNKSGKIKQRKDLKNIIHQSLFDL